MAGTSFSLPTLMQLYGDDPDSGTYGNPDLEPEQSLNIEAGIGGNWRFFRFDAGYFFQDVQDMISSVSLDNGDSTYENVDGTTKIQGVEGQIGVGPFKGFTLSLSATWVAAKDKETDEQLEQIPEFYGTANLGYRTSTGKYGADLMTRYTGDIYERDLSPFDDVKYGNYFIADVSTFIHFGRESQHKLTLRIENIFDEEYATRYNRGTNTDGERFLYNQNGLPRNFILGYCYTF
jgi:vitamin B12 transporter